LKKTWLFVTVSQNSPNISHGSVVTYLMYGGIFTASSELHKVLFLVLWLLCLCTKYLGYRWTDLHQIHREQCVWSLTGTSLNVKVKGQGHYGQKRHFLALLAACVRYVW